MSVELAKLPLNRPQLEVAMMWLDEGAKAVNASGKTPLYLVVSSLWEATPDVQRVALANALIDAGVPIGAKAYTDEEASPRVGFAVNFARYVAKELLERSVPGIEELRRRFGVPSESTSA